jgi:hypothetical protein
MAVHLYTGWMNMGGARAGRLFLSSTTPPPPLPLAPTIQHASLQVVTSNYNASSNMYRVLKILCKSVRNTYSNMDSFMDNGVLFR